jgi:hypothetical protein
MKITVSYGELPSAAQTIPGGFFQPFCCTVERIKHGAFLLQCSGAVKLHSMMQQVRGKARKGSYYLDFRNWQ